MEMELPHQEIETAAHNFEMMYKAAYLVQINSEKTPPEVIEFICLNINIFKFEEVFPINNAWFYESKDNSFKSE